MLTYIWSKEAYTTTSDSVGETLIISKHNLMSVFCRASQASSMTWSISNMLLRPLPVFKVKDCLYRFSSPNTQWVGGDPTCLVKIKGGCDWEGKTESAHISPDFVVIFPTALNSEIQNVQLEKQFCTNLFFLSLYRVLCYTGFASCSFISKESGACSVSMKSKALPQQAQNFSLTMFV